MPRFLIWIILLIVNLCDSSLIRAQTKPAVLPMTSVRLLNTSGVPMEVFCKTEESSDIRRLGPRAMGESFLTKRGRPLELMKMLVPTGATPGTAPVPVVVARVELPKDTEQCLVALRPLAQKSGGDIQYQGQVVETAEKVFPLGTVMLLNFSPTSFAVHLDQDVVNVAPFQQRLASPKLDTYGRFRARVALQKGVDVWARVSSEVTTLLKGERMYYIMFFDPTYDPNSEKDSYVPRALRPNPQFLWRQFLDNPSSLPLSWK